MEICTIGEPQVVVLALMESAGQGVVLAHEWPGAGGCLCLADQDGGAELVPGGGHAAGVDSVQGAINRERAPGR